MNLFIPIIFLIVNLIFPYYLFASEIELKPCIQISHCAREEWNVVDINNPLSEIKGILENTKRIRIVDFRENYIHAEAISRIMKYVDDLEISLKSSQNILVIRSESRVGEGDFGVNQKRIDLIESKLFNS